MRKTIYWLGWIILFALPVVYGIQIYMIQNLPPVELWKWSIPIAAAALIYFARNRDEVLHHHLT